MAVKINAGCVTCGACLWECPQEAILPGSPRPVVDEDACTECYGSFGESQCMVVCPADAIVPVPEPIDTLEAKFRRMHPDSEAQDTWIWRRLVRCPAASSQSSQPSPDHDS